MFYKKNFKLYVLLKYCAFTINSNIKIEKYIDFSNNQFFVIKKKKSSCLSCCLFRGVGTPYTGRYKNCWLRMKTYNKNLHFAIIKKKKYKCKIVGELIFVLPNNKLWHKIMRYLIFLSFQTYLIYFVYLNLFVFSESRCKND